MDEIDIDFSAKDVEVSAGGFHSVVVSATHVSVRELLQEIPLADVVGYWCVDDLLEEIGEDKVREWLEKQ
jgi:hypothetical protein